MARRGTRIIGGLVAAGAAVMAAAVTGAGPAAAAAPVAGQPVVLVHGWGGSTADVAVLADRLRAEGHPAYPVVLPGQENVANAEAIATTVERARYEHGGARVGIIGHSMGGLSARYYLQELGGAEHVGHYVSMGTAHLGYQPACHLPPDLGGQMCPDSAFMAELGEGDPTPGDVHYSTLTSSLDDTRDQRLDGAQCHTEIPGVPHDQEPRNDAFVDAALTSLTGACP